MIFQDITHVLKNGRKFHVKILREDLSQPLLQGNKFWKLKYNIAEAIQQGIQQIITFGGAYSNHIHATAIAGKINGIQTIGIIRGDEPKDYNSTLKFAKEQGMKLHFISRENYRKKYEPGFIQKLQEDFGKSFIIPEGGSNALGLKGCEEWGIQMANTADVYCLAAGTAATAAGIAKALLSHQPEAEVWAFSALKNGEFLKGEAEGIANTNLSNLKIIPDYHFGGYAKYNKELLDFIDDMDHKYHLPLEQVYTGKTFFGVFDLAEKRLIPNDKSICFIHTGGLQGKLVRK